MQGVKITDTFAQRIKSAVLRVEAEPIASSSGVIPRRIFGDVEPSTTLRRGVTHDSWFPGSPGTIYVVDKDFNETDETLEGVLNEHGPVLPKVPVIVAERVPDYESPILVSSGMPPVLFCSASGEWLKNTQKTVSVTINDETTSIDAWNAFSNIVKVGSYVAGVSWTQEGWRLIAAEC